MTDIANTIINVKVLDNSITLPKYETISSAGMDIRAFIPEGIIEIEKNCFFCIFFLFYCYWGFYVIEWII